MTFPSSERAFLPQKLAQTTNAQSNEPWPTADEINYLIDHDWDKLLRIADQQYALWAKSFTAQRHSQKVKFIEKAKDKKYRSTRS